MRKVIVSDREAWPMRDKGCSPEKNSRILRTGIAELKATNKFISFQCTDTGKFNRYINEINEFASRSSKKKL